MKAKISPELLQKIKDSVNILEVVGEHVVLRKSGANASGLCPFHSERSPSFSVSESKGLYHCYGCKKSGDLVTFVMEIHGISFPEAVEELAERARVALPNDWSGGSPSDDPEVQRKRREARERLHVLHKLNLFTMAYFRQQLGQLPTVERYFRNRGVQGDLATNFRVGAAPNAWDSLSRHMTDKKAPLPQAVELGLIRPSTKATPGSTGYFDLFRNRAMFPIIDMRGRVAGFGGRKMPESPTDAPGAATADGIHSPKYMNSPESLIFQKSKLAFGLFQAQKHIREKDEVILVEGYFDVLALHAAGFENVVATCGTSLTPEHLTLFRRFAKRVTILFDGDKAGISATERAMEIGLDHGQILYGASLPEGLDPDELLFDQETGKPLPEGKERMAAILGATRPLLSSQISVEAQAAAQGPEALTQALKKTGGWLKRYADPVGREVWIEDVVRQLGVNRALLMQAMGGRDSAGGAPTQVRPNAGSPLPKPNPAGGPSIIAKPVATTSAQASPQTPSRAVPHPFAPPGYDEAPRPVPHRPRNTSPRESKRLSQAEVVLLQGLAKGGEFSRIFAETRAKLPANLTLGELFDYPPAREFMNSLLTEPGQLERFRAAPEHVLNGELDPQVRSTLTEALVSSGESASVADALFLKQDFQLSIDRALGRIWARFSQRIRMALTDAEAKQDAGLHAELMKEYLDVQRKIKEFISFYDEA